MRSRGFTLIELLLVLAIIGVIAAIAVPALLGQRARARDKSAIANVNGMMNDLVGACDAAQEKGLNAAAQIAAMEAVLGRANGRGERNPWQEGSPAWAAQIQASAMPTLKGEATFYVNAIASPTLLIGRVVTQDVQISTGTSRYEKRASLE